MKDITKYISIIAVIVGLYSCSLKEEFMPVNRKTSVEFVARLTGFNNVDITTKSAPTEEFETAVYTAYFLLFDSSTGARIAVDSVDVSSGSLSQTIVGKMPGPVTACFIANIPQGFAAKNLTSLTALNSAVLDITYATYSEAGGYLGVPKLTVNGETKLCIPMFGSKNISNITNGGNIEIPVKRMFAKISMNIKMQLTSIGIGQIAPTTVNYELKQYQLRNLPTKVRLVGNDNENETTYESGWADNSSAFIGNNLTPVSSGNNLGLQTININDSDSNTDNDSTVVPGIDFCFYVPEYYLQPISEPNEDQKYKPLNYDYEDKYAIYVELEGEVNRSLIDNTGIRHKIYLGGDNTKNFILKKNINYINQITIKGIENNENGSGANLDHRVSTDIINNPVAQAGQSANCYVIGQTGEYTIPAFKGAYSNLSNAPLCLAGKRYVDTRVHVPFNKSQTIGIDKIPFKVDPTYDPETNTISFTIDQIDASILGSLDYVPNGNVILELQYKESEEGSWITEWSWHLWCLTKVNILGTGWGEVGEETMPDGKTKLHDRNIGVVSGTPIGAQTGFYYKYGRKEPFVDGAYHGGGTLYDDEGTPIPHSWSGSGKSPTDPCPPGYRVPNSSVWTSSKQNHMDFGSSYFTYKKRSVSIVGGVEVDLVAINYPYSGRVTPSLSIESEAYMLDNTTTSGTITSTISDWSGRYRNIVYSLDLNYMFSALHGADNMLLYGYCDISDNMKITQYQYYTIAWWSTYSEGDWDFAPDVVKALAKDQIEEKLADYVGAYIIKAPDTSHGYQVRCVSETSIKSN